MQQYTVFKSDGTTQRINAKSSSEACCLATGGNIQRVAQINNYYDIKGKRYYYQIPGEPFADYAEASKLGILGGCLNMYEVEIYNSDSVLIFTLRSNLVGLQYQIEAEVKARKIK